MQVPLAATVATAAFSFAVLLFVAVIVIKSFSRMSNPRLNLPARVAGKRTETRIRPGEGDEPDRPVTAYFVSFEYRGSRQDFRVQRHEYEQILPGMTGKLSFQGDRFIAFEPGGNAAVPVGSEVAD